MNLLPGDDVVAAPRAAFANRFTDNVVCDSCMDIVRRGRDHEVTGNRFEGCRRAAVLLTEAEPDGNGFAADNTLVEGNTMLDCGGGDPDPLAKTPRAGVVLFHERPQRIGANTITGQGEPIVVGTRPLIDTPLCGRAPT